MMSRENEQHSLSDRIDLLCDRFEADWKSAKSSRIEDLLAGWTEPDRSELLRHLLAVEIDCRRERQEELTVDEFARRFPDDTILIRGVFESPPPTDETQETVIRDIESAKAETVDVSMGSTDETFVPGKSDSTAVSESGGKRFGDYELLEEIGRGGMGVVYKARQTKLNRLVALKMIKSGELAGEEEVMRFQAEAEAAAALDHPGIVPIYEVGEQNGQHFFSMGFVEGEGLDARLKDGPLPPEEAAQLVKIIAEAVQFAHEKGIIHRDLKPANVLLAIEPDSVNPDRVHRVRLYSPRITDFGLAKHIAGDSGMTATGQILGTPSYMPPEQATGKTDEISPLADVYSLGAMLYCTLTGRPPFQAANVMETLKQVLEQEPVSPRQLNPAVDKDLETVCLKCLEKEPDKRFTSAQALADELNRVLTGKPIHARPLNKPARLWRWCKRNPLGAAVVGLLAILMIGSPIVAAFQIQLREEADENLQLATKNLNLANENLDKFKVEKERADGESQLARQQRDRAQRELREHKATLSRYVNTITEAPLLKDPRFSKLQQKLLKDAFGHHLRYLKQHQGDLLSQQEVLRTIFRIGKIARSTDSFSPLAMQAFQTALDLVEKLARKRPHPAYEHTLALIHIQQGGIFNDTGRPQDALLAYQQALNKLNTLVRKHAKNPQYRVILADCYSSLGGLKGSAKKKSEALESYENAMRLRQELVNQSPENDQYQRDLASSYVSLAVLHGDAGRTNQAFESYRIAQDILERLNRKTPKDAVISCKLAGLYLNLSLRLTSLGNIKQAIELARKSVHLRKQLAKDNTTSTICRDGLAKSTHQLGLLLRRTGRPAEAIAAYQNVIELLERLSQRNPGILAYRDGVAMVSLNLGHVLVDQNRYKAGLVAHQKAREIYGTLARDFPEDFHYQTGLAAATLSVGTDQQQKENFSAARIEYGKVIDIWKKLLAVRPNEVEYKSGFAVALMNLGLLEKFDGHPQVAAKRIREAIAIRSQLVGDRPQDAESREKLARSYFNLGAILATSKGKAIPAMLKAATIYEELTLAHPGNAKNLSMLGETYTNLAVAYKSLKQFPPAIELYRKAVGVGERLMRQFPNDSNHELFAATVYFKFGMLYDQLNRKPDALRTFQKMLDTQELLLPKNKGNTILQRDIARKLVLISLRYERAGDNQQALKSVVKALAIWEALAAKKPATISPDTSRIVEARFARARTLDNLGRYREAVQAWMRIVQGSKGADRATASLRVLRSLAKAGSISQALSLSRRMSDANPRNGDMQFTAAIVYAIVAGKVSASQADQFAAQAMVHLRRAHAIGFFRYPKIKIRSFLQTHPDFNALRPREDFRAFAKSVGVKLPAWARKPGNRARHSRNPELRQVCFQDGSLYRKPLTERFRISGTVGPAAC